MAQNRYRSIPIRSDCTRRTFFRAAGGAIAAGAALTAI